MYDFFFVGMVSSRNTKTSLISMPKNWSMRDVLPKRKSMQSLKNMTKFVKRPIKRLLLKNRYVVLLPVPVNRNSKLRNVFFI